jgi:hypothetical protein
MSEINSHYAAVLADLRGRRSKLQADLSEIDVAIGAIQRQMQSSAGQPHLPLPELAQNHASGDGSKRGGQYANISVRWGVMWRLAEYAPMGERTGEIANALLEGGYESKADRFPNLVSAVLSNMKSKGEVESSEDGGYRLTEQGRQTWALIKHGAKFREAQARNRRFQD